MLSLSIIVKQISILRVKIKHLGQRTPLLFECGDMLIEKEYIARKAQATEKLIN